MRKLVLFMLLVMVYLVVVPLSGTQAAYSATIKKCKVKAGKIAGLDSISFSGILQGVTVGDLGNAIIEGQIEVTLDSADMSSYPLFFDVEDDYVKKGKYKSPKVKTADKTEPKTSFKLDANNGKFLFTAKNVDLTGLSCPIELHIKIGSYAAWATLNEDIVNGKKPVPIQFMMGVKNTLRVDKVKVKFGKKTASDSLSVKGAFTTVAGTNYNKDHPVVVMLASQDWTVGGNQFNLKKYAEICKKATANEGGNASIKLDFAKCTFVINIKNTNIADYGQADFGIDVFGSSIVIVAAVDLGPKQSYALEELRRYDVLGAWWDYSSNYSVKGSATGYGSFSDSGVAPASVDVRGSYGNINGYPCTIVDYDGEGESETDYWYTNPSGTYIGKWIGAGGDVTWEVNITSGLQVAPPELRVGQSHTATGTHMDGRMTIWLPDTEISVTELSGSGKSTCKFVRHEQVTVLGSTYTAVKVEQTYVVDGTADVKIYTPLQYTTGTASLTIKKTWWGVPGIGIVKSQNSLTLKLSAKDAGKLSLTTKETDVLTGYGG